MVWSWSSADCGVWILKRSLELFLLIKQRNTLEVMNFLGAVHDDLPENTNWLDGCTQREYVFNANGPIAIRNHIVDSLSAKIFSETDVAKADHWRARLAEVNGRNLIYHEQPIVDPFVAVRDYHPSAAIYGGSKVKPYDCINLVRLDAGLYFPPPHIYNGNLAVLNRKYKSWE